MLGDLAVASCEAQLSGVSLLAWRAWRKQALCRAPKMLCRKLTHSPKLPNITKNKLHRCISRSEPAHERRPFACIVTTLKAMETRRVRKQKPSRYRRHLNSLALGNKMDPTLLVRRVLQTEFHMSDRRRSSKSATKRMLCELIFDA